MTEQNYPLLMIEKDWTLEDKYHCTGCSACMQRCPKKAIHMKVDNEGFRCPDIDKDSCVNCRMCVKICHLNNTIRQSDNYKQRYYAVKLKDYDARMVSRSGGLFFALCDYIISVNGVVYGTVLTEQMNVEVVRASTLDQCRAMQGSKYAESNITGLYSLAANDLKLGKIVLFSGTACQIAGLYSYLGGCRLDNLYTFDIVCHGVVSHKIFNSYIKFLESKYRGKVEHFIFRDKKYGWHTSFESFYIHGKKYIFTNYTSLFLSHKALRPSCSKCFYANYQRIGDLSGADSWEIDKVYPDFDDNCGVSTCFINNQKGEFLFHAIESKLEIRALTAEQCSQPNLLSPTEMPADRQKFWDLYKKKGFRSVLRRYGKYRILRRIKWGLFTSKKFLKRQ